MKRKKLINLAVAILLVLSIPTSFALAEGEDPPPDPGVGDEQDLILAQTVLWIIPYGSGLYINDEAGDIFLDWENVDVSSTGAPVEGLLAINTVCGIGVGIGGCGDPIIVDPNDLTPEELGLPVDIGSEGYQNDCDNPEYDCEKEEDDVVDGGTFYPTNDANVVVIKAGTGEFFFIPFSPTCDPQSQPYCVAWNEDGSITVVRNSEYLDPKEISNIQFWHTNYQAQPLPEPDNNCPDVWVEPGAITIGGSQISPDFAVIVGQDPDQTGVTLEWNINIAPTVVTYETWEIVNYNVLECVEYEPYAYQYAHQYAYQYLQEVGYDYYWAHGGAQNAYGCENHNCGCEVEWYPVVEEVWGCVPQEIVYPEGINELIAAANLSLNSRAWVEGELAVAYPGAYLIHPDWGLEVPAECVWVGGVCTLSVTETLAVTDPGWYDIKLLGTTAGTLATPPRSFNDVAGTFGVFMLENSALTQ